jgi:Bacterial Ig domain
MRTMLLLAVTLTSMVATADVSRPTTRGANSCGTVQEPAVADGFERYLLAPGTQRIVFLNRFGGTYNVAVGATDSATNTASTIVSGNRQPRTANIKALSSMFDWPMIVECVKSHYVAINVRFVETEPATGPYIEAVVGGAGSDLGFSASSGILGVAAADNFCGVTETGIAFSLAEEHEGLSQRNFELCTTVSHEIGHLLALEHETLATDLMSYVPVTQAASKAFVDMASTCGLYPGQPQGCSCTSTMQNSFNRLVTYVGPRPVETMKPTLSIVSPANGDTVAPVFTVVATASDDMAMGDVRVLLDGVEGGANAVAVDGKYTILVKNAALGDHQMMAIARDEAGNETTQSIALKVAKSQIGDTCVANEACEGNICANGEDGNFCTQMCETANDTCPSDFECADVGGTSVCVSSGCGCTITDPREAVAPLLVFGLGLVISRRKRARR